MNKNPSCGVFKPQAAHSMVINHPKLKVWADNIHSDEDKWSLCNMQMPKGYSTETAVFQYYLYWRISHITQFCWVFQQSVCWTEKNQICNVKMRSWVLSDRPSVEVCSACIDLSHMTGSIIQKAYLKDYMGEYTGQRSTRTCSLYWSHL